MINVGTVIGNITKDAELKPLDNGKFLAKFSIAYNDREKRNGDWQDYTSFFDCVYFPTEKQAQYLKKGTKVALTYKIKQERWEKDGQNRSKVVLNVREFMLVGGKSDSAPQYSSAPLPQQYGDDRFSDNGPDDASLAPF